MITLTAKEVLPEDGTAGTLVGRVWLSDVAGPAVVAVRGDGVFDVSATFATVSALCEPTIPPPHCRLRRERASAISTPSSPIRRPTGATPQSRGCWRRSICRC